MPTVPIHTIGHSTRPAEVLLQLLQQHGIRYLADVRSVPRSRFNPQYNQNRLKAFLEQNGITYVFMGNELGGRPSDPECYVNGQPDYGLVKTRPFFRQGIHRLKTAYEKQVPLAILCSEAKPQECHRGRLIAQVLHAEGIPVTHIDENGQAKTHGELLQQTQNFGKGNGLFGPE